MCARQSPGQKIKQKQYQSTDCCSIFYEPIQIREDTRLQPGWLLLSSISVCYRAPPRTINRHGIASRHERHRSRGNQGGFHCTHAHAQTKTKIRAVTTLRRPAQYAHFFHLAPSWLRIWVIICSSSPHFTLTIPPLYVCFQRHSSPRRTLKAYLTGSRTG